MFNKRTSRLGPMFQSFLRLFPDKPFQPSLVFVQVRPEPTHVKHLLPSVIMPSVIKLSAIMPNINMLSVDIPSVIMHSVITYA